MAYKVEIPFKITQALNARNGMDKRSLICLYRMTRAATAHKVTKRATPLAVERLFRQMNRK